MPSSGRDGELHVCDDDFLNQEWWRDRVTGLSMSMMPCVRHESQFSSAVNLLIFLKQKYAI